MRKDAAAQASRGVWVEVRIRGGTEEMKKAHGFQRSLKMSAHLLPGVRGLFRNNKINGHKTDDHMQTTEGPKELTKKKKPKQKTNKRICQGDCSQPL